MSLFIRVKNGSPVGHPITEENLRDSFPNVNPDSLPQSFSPFERVSLPSIGAYQVYDGVTYQEVDGGYKDVHRVREMTSEEVSQKQQDVKDFWANNGFPSWVFNSETCAYEPPVPMPDDGQEYAWDESTTSWVSVN